MCRTRYDELRKLSEKLKELRLNAGYTKVEIARELNLDPKSYSRYENAANCPSFEKIIKLSKLYDVSLEYLLNFSPIENDLPKKMPDKFGERLKRIREIRGCSRKKMAYELRVGYSLYATYERGTCNPPLELFLEICDILQVNPTDLLEVKSDEIA